MNQRNKFLIAACTLLCTNLYAEDEKAPSATPAKAEEKKPAVSANYQFLPSPVSAGRIAFNNRQAFTVQVQNSGKEDLTIKKVRSSCACVQVESFTDKPIKPGERGTIKCVITADEKEGQTRKLLYVHLSDAKDPIAQVVVNAEFTKPEGSKVVLSNQTIEFGKVPLVAIHRNGKDIPGTTSVVDGKAVIQSEGASIPDEAGKPNKSEPAGNDAITTAKVNGSETVKGSNDEGVKTDTTAIEMAKGKRLAVCRIMNFGDQPLRITEIVNKNKALELRLDSSEPVAPHKGVTLRAFLDPQVAGKGPLEEEVFLMTDSIQTPAVSLKVTATVE